MELDTNKRKYRLSSSTTPSPSEENKGFSTGYYHKNKNIFTINGYGADVTDGKETPAFDNYAYASHEDDNVFKPKSDIYFDPSSLQRGEKGKKSRVESARDENVPKKKGEKGCLMLLCFLTFLGLLAGIAVIIYVQFFKEKSPDQSTQASPVILIGSITLKDDWNEDLRNSSSPVFKSTSTNISAELDIIMQNGNLSQFYVENKILSFSQGSIVATLRIYFRPDFGLGFQNVEALASSAELHVIEAVQSGYTTLNIQAVNLTGEMITPTTLPLSTASSTISSTSSTVSTLSSTTSKSTSSLPPSSSPESTTPEQSTTTTPKPTTTTTSEPTTTTPPEQTTSTTPEPTTTTPEPTTTTPEPTTTTPEPTTTTPEPTTTTTPEPTTTTPELTTTTPEPTTTTTPEPTTTTPELTTTTPVPTTTTTREPTTTTTSEPTTTIETAEPASTTPLPGTCIPLPVEKCQTLGRNSTMLPNFFNQTTIQETLALFEMFKMQKCSDNALLYICDMMYPRCEEEQLPCRDFCLSIQMECGSNFELAKERYCNQLPTTKCTHPVVTTTSTTLATTTTSLSTFPTTITTAVPLPSSTVGFCLLLQVPECQALGHTSVMFPNPFQHMSIEQALSFFEQYKISSCSASSMYYLCNMFFPKCDPATGVITYPCQGHCNATYNSCPGLPVADLTYCVQLQNTNCEPKYVEPTTTTEQPETTPQPELCLSLNIPECQAVGHTSVTFPNIYRHQSIEEASVYFEAYKNSSCSDSSMFYLCNVLFPKCDPSNGLMSYPCQDHCNAIQLACPALSNLATPAVCSSLLTANCVPVYQKPDLCLQLKVPECQAVGHTSVMFPNPFQHTSIEQALVFFEQYKNSSCSDSSMYYLCNMFFPKCDPATGAITYPCQEHCNATHDSCPSLAVANISYCVQLVTENCEPSYPEPITTTQQPGLCFTNTIPECLAVNHTVFMLPNLFGDTTVEAAIKNFNSYKNQSCTDSTMFYICDLFFPGCDVNTGDFKYPCSDLCYDAQNVCPGLILANPAYCQNLPTCEVKDKCLAVNAPECTALGLNYTKLPNTFGHTDLATAKTYFDQLKQQSCSDTALFYSCLMLFPPCDETTGAIKFACKEDCLAVNQECGNGTVLASLTYCNQLVDVSSGRCYPVPLTTTTTITTSPATTTVPQDICMDLPVPECRSVGRNKTLLPNGFGHSTISDGLSVFDLFKANACSQSAMYYLCTFMFPDCEVNVQKYPCKEYCLSVQAECGVNFTLAQSVYCNQLPTQGCVSSFPGVTTVTTTTPPKPRQNCSETEQYTCPSDGHCIMKEWMCDGEPDCQDQSDEGNCSSCSSTEFTCLDGTCVPAQERCNKVPTCPDQSDERNCVSLTTQSILMLPYQERSVPLCYQSWSDSYGAEVCRGLGLGNFTYSKPVTYYNRDFAHLDINGQVPSYLGNIVVRSECQNAQVVELKCEPRGCGQRLVGSSQTNFIIGGNDAVPGHWPWQVSVQIKLGNNVKHICGGSLIAPNFVVTATHCLNVLVERNVLLGATNRGVVEITQRQYGIRRIIHVNEKFLKYGPGDITLFELNDTVQYTPYIQPICFPEEGEKFTETSICYATGWGFTSPGDQSYSTMLKQLKMRLWDTQKCNSSKHWNGNITSGYICAGYESSLKSVCTGDSGGPLVCKDNAGIWKLVGISSFVSINCNVSHLPNVFTDVTAYLPWIKSQIECKFQCDNGRCLYDNDLVCNRQNDCGDNSDETRTCNISVNCTFDDNYLCGYNVSGFIWSSGSDNSQAQSSFPWTDHTIGHYPGHYMFGRYGDVSEAILTSPKFQTNSQSCVRFYYNRRGELYDNMLVQILEHSPSGSVYPAVTKYLVGQGNYEDNWRIGFFDLSAGTYQIVFKVTDKLKNAIDDVKVISGSCAEKVCDEGLFRCADDKGNPVCLPPSSQCNIVKQCNKDETNCQASASRYSCDFEKAMQCEISQTTLDKGEFLLTNGSYLKELVLFQEAFNEHTNNDPNGWMLFALTNGHQLIGDNVTMTQNLVLNNQRFCLTFFYRASTDMTFKVSLKTAGDVYELWNFTDRSTSDWTKAQMQLPLVSEGDLTYQLVRLLPASNKYYKAYMAIDDISITPGECPVYDCPSGTIKCASENYCYPNTSHCNRIVDCPDESDEANCSCSSDEFSCSNGRCIPQSSSCDTKADCLDASDEGAVCDSLRSVTCTFVNLFSCGYTSNEGEFNWRRWSGSTPSFYTGPSFDHTIGDTTGHYFYAEGNEGFAGDVATLTSPNFTTGVGQSLGFYYHIYTQSAIFLIQSEGLSVVAQFSDGQRSQLWWQNQTSGSDWAYGCVDLPDNTELNVQFVTKRIGLDHKGIFDADVAIDDIALLVLPCSTSGDGASTISTPKPPDVSETTTSVPECGFRCNNNFCIHANLRCNGFWDCRNGEDEENCPS